MEDELFIKIQSTTKGKTVKRLINVCAWCPKNTYPKLETHEDYTHGLCEKHYQILRSQKL